MNIITSEMERITGRPFAPHMGQVQDLAIGMRSYSEQAIANALEAQCAALVEALGNQLGIPALFHDGLPPRLISSQVNLSGPITTASGTLRISEEIALAMLKVGQRMADPVRIMYQVILGREPDDAGYAFWNGHFRAGVKLSELCRYMEAEKTAGAK